jgi:hypothetical protein
MANSLPGSPIVGFYNENKGDFEEHNRAIEISNGNFTIKDKTKPYGFVDLNAKVWFQKYLDDGVEHEYLCTEGWLWTGQYPECKRIVDKGNNHSMELDEDTLDANWSKLYIDGPEFFIINEAIVSKLCVLGEDCEPCFEGSRITSLSFSLDDKFKTELYSIMNEVKNLVDKGGAQQMYTTYAVEVGDSLWNTLYDATCEKYSLVGVYEDGEQKFAIAQGNEDNKYYRLNFSVCDGGVYSLEENMTEVADYTPAEEVQFSPEAVAQYKKNKDEEDKSKKENKSNPDNKSEDENSNKEEKSNDGKDPEKKGSKEDEDNEDDEKKKKKKEYSLDEIPEYVDLKTKYSELEEKYNTLATESASLQEQINSLSQFKLETERKDKEAMINGTFYMLSDEDKKDVIENIDKYSLSDIEKELSVICVRNKVNFNLDENNSEKKDPTVYNLNSQIENEATPAWVKAALETAKTLK